MTLINLSPVAELLISAAALVATRYLIPWLKEKAGRERTARLMRCAEIAVHAAEQMYQESGSGKAKLDYVLKCLRERGFDLSPDELRAAAEAAVYEMSSAIDAA